MPQLDQFPILFQFKSFVFSFGLLYMVFLLFIVPVLHGTMKSRKMYLNFITSMISLSNFHSSSMKFSLLENLKKLSSLENKSFKLFEVIFFNSTLIKFYNSLQ
jgi:hypothetical protein